MAEAWRKQADGLYKHPQQFDTGQSYLVELMLFVLNFFVRFR